MNQVEYNPYIINVISLLLVFVSEADTYDIIYMMIEGSTSMSVERQESLRWHFSLTSNQTDKFAREFFKNVKKVSPSINTINDHLNTEGIDKFYIFNEIIGSFFIGYVPFPVDCQTISGSPPNVHCLPQWRSQSVLSFCLCYPQNDRTIGQIIH